MATGRLIGSSTDGVSNLSASFLNHNKWVADYTGIVSEIKVYSLVAGNVKVALYADDGGEPGALLSTNNEGQAVSAGQWNAVSIPEVSITAGTTYWISGVWDTTGAVTYNGGGRVRRYKGGQVYSTFTFPDPAGTGYTSGTQNESMAGWGVIVLTSSGMSQPVDYGAPQLNLTILLSGIAQVTALGIPTVIKLLQIIVPSGIAQAIGYGTPKLKFKLKPSGIAQVIAIGMPAFKYPQIISPSGIAVPVAIGIPSISIYGIVRPQGIPVIVSCGSPTILKYVWHVILDGQYAVETPKVNRAYIIGRDQYDNPVYGTAVDSTELGLVGERLDFQQEVAIPTDSQAASMAGAVLSKMRLTGKRGVILIPPNCGQELFDVVQISDSGANQSAVTFRVVGIRFEYNPRQAVYQHKLILGAP
jgi:hypothetical protein